MPTTSITRMLKYHSVLNRKSLVQAGGLRSPRPLFLDQSQVRSIVESSFRVVGCTVHSKCRKAHGGSGSMKQAK